MVNPPYRSSANQWITVPPRGYGAIQWVCAHLIRGLVELGQEVALLGAPGSPLSYDNLEIVDVATPAEFERWLRTASIDIVHDHTNGLVHPRMLPDRVGFISTHHLTGRPTHPTNCVYVSTAQRDAAGGAAPVLPLPVDPDQYQFMPEKGKYLLFLGRISAHKGAYEAAAFAASAGRRLVLAGPSWEPEYIRRIESDFGDAVDQVGEVGGEQRSRLIARATAVMVLSQPVMGPWGHLWCEPGATVVSEAAISGTPSVTTMNGCLPEIVPGVGTFVAYGSKFDPSEAMGIIDTLPDAYSVRRAALARWHYLDIARRYHHLYELVLAGRQWS